MKYFGEEVNGLKADIERHRAKEAELDARIAELEALNEYSSRDMIYLKAYRNLRAYLLQSKAEVASKIGKKK